MEKETTLNAWKIAEADESLKEDRLKRLFDIGLSFIGILVYSPLWLLFSLAVWRRWPGLLTHMGMVRQQKGL